METARLASLMLMAILAGSVAMATMASAAPEFKPTGASVTGTSGADFFAGAGEEITCAKDTAASGTVASSTLIGGITTHFLECTAKTNEGQTCPAHSASAPLTNLILTRTLREVLGLILPKPASGSDVALVVLPASGSAFLTLEGTCIATTVVSGSIAGLVEPVGTATTKGTLSFDATEGQNIKEVDLSTGGVVKPHVTAFGGAVVAEGIEAGTFGSATEVT
jgi:hypothetical protein